MKKVRNQGELAEYRSSLYALLASVYIQAPTRTTLSLNWEPILKLLGFPKKGAEKSLKDIEKGLRLIKDYVLKKDLLGEEGLVDLSKDWTRLVRGVDIKGLLPPNESLYRTGRLQEKPVQEINRLFSKMGIRVPEEWHQPSDYIGVELDFMHLLCEKEKEAWEKNQSDSVHEIAEIEKSFLENHLGLWAPIFSEKMIEQAREDFFRGIGRLTKGIVGYDRIWTLHFLHLTQDEGKVG
jgi:TorA maturation chaperone TorD